jgi:hypothetical protein
MRNGDYLKSPPNTKEEFVGKVEYVEVIADIFTDKDEYLQDILYNKYMGKKVRITIELLEDKE